MKNTKAILTVLAAGLLSHTIGQDLPSLDDVVQNQKPAHVLKAPQTMGELKDFRQVTNLRNVGGVRERIMTTHDYYDLKNSTPKGVSHSAPIVKHVQAQRKKPDYIIAPCHMGIGLVYKMAINKTSVYMAPDFEGEVNWNWDLRSPEKGDKRYQYILGLCLLDGTAVKEDDAEGFKWLLWAANQGHVGAQNAVAACYFSGEGVQADENKAAQWWIKAAEGGDPLALWTLGWMQWKTPELAIESWRDSARKGFYEAQVDLAAAYLWGIGVEVDQAEAFKWISLAMVSGEKINPTYDELWKEWLEKVRDPSLFKGVDPKETFYYLYGIKYDDPLEGFYYLYNGIHWWAQGNPQFREEGEQRALEFFATNKFHVVRINPERETGTYFGVGWHNRTTTKTPHYKEYHPNSNHIKFLEGPLDEAQTLKLHEVKEHVDTWHTRRNTGYQFMAGEVVPRNLRIAYMFIAVALIEWLPEDEYWNRGGKFEANRKLLDSISSLMTPEEILKGQESAKNLATKLGIERTSEKVETLRRAIEVGDPVAKRTLAGYYFSGEQGVLRDYKRGVTLLRNVADQGNAGAQFDLGMCYILGRGVERNDLTGKEWLLKASKAGSVDAKKVLVSDWPEEFAKVWVEVAKDLDIDPSIYP